MHAIPVGIGKDRAGDDGAGEFDDGRIAEPVHGLFAACQDGDGFCTGDGAGQDGAELAVRISETGAVGNAVAFTAGVDPDRRIGDRVATAVHSQDGDDCSIKPISLVGGGDADLGGVGIHTACDDFGNGRIYKTCIVNVRDSHGLAARCMQND